MKPLQQHDQLILDYLDGNLTEEQIKALRAQIDGSSDLQKRLNELRAIHKALSDQQALVEPSASFTQKVMINLDRMAVISTISPRNGILLLIGLIVATGLAVVMLSSGAFDGWVGQYNVPPINLPELKDSPITNIPFNGKIVMKIIIIVNTALGFILLDRTVLKPLFDRRAKHSW